jgi:hypothetical protein
VRRLGLLVLLAGCDRVFGLLPITQVGDASNATDGSEDGFVALCPQPYDPLRYQRVTNPAVPTQTQAIADCLRKGMGLVVIDNPDEQLGLLSDPLLHAPYWLGVAGDGTGTFTPIDGCPLYSHWDTDQPAAPFDANKCVCLLPNGRFADLACDQTMLGMDSITGVCEAAPVRPECVNTNDLTLDDGVAHTRAESVANCAMTSRKLLELRSTEDLNNASQVAEALGLSTVWLGATFDGHVWHDDDGCPQVLPWMSGEPRAGGCVVYVFNLNGSTIPGAKVVDCTTAMAQTICGNAH